MKRNTHITFISFLAASAALFAFTACGSSKVEAPAPADEPVVEETVVQSEVNEEYARSVGEVKIDEDTFAKDKAVILEIIDQLSVIMKNRDYNGWLSYINQESIDYYKLRPNLQKAEKQLPVKGLKLKNLQDYFTMVFIPARSGRQVTEIRYDSETYVKAVQVNEDKDLIYYYFVKENGKWMVDIPKIED